MEMRQVAPTGHRSTSSDRAATGATVTKKRNADGTTHRRERRTGTSLNDPSVRRRDALMHKKRSLMGDDGVS
jgi:hypothetical protein